MQPVIEEQNLLGSFTTTVQQILADDDNIIQGGLGPQGTIIIKATYDAGKVVRVCAHPTCQCILNSNFPIPLKSVDQSSRV